MKTVKETVIGVLEGVIMLIEFADEYAAHSSMPKLEQAAELIKEAIKVLR